VLIDLLRVRVRRPVPLGRSAPVRQRHAFWPDDVRLVVGERVGADLVASHRDVTDAHLLVLAEARHGRLVTFDAGLSRLLGDRPAELLHQLGHGS
jgi:predicted nucleic acid-binding protein